MFFDETPLLNLGTSFELFNSLAYLDGNEGRLTVSLDFSLYTNLRWEFKAVSSDVYEAISVFEYEKIPPKKICSCEKPEPIMLIEEPNRASYGNFGLKILRGSTDSVVYGKPADGAHFFECYLVNTEFLRVSTYPFEWTDAVRVFDSSMPLSRLSPTSLPAIEGQITEKWSVRIESPQESINWLKPEDKNFGSRITAKTTFFQTNKLDLKPEDLDLVSLTEQENFIESFFSMMSFANGGYSFPVITSSWKYDGLENKMASCKVNTRNPITSLEDIASSWFSSSLVDLLQFMTCFNSFQKMLENNEWKQRWLPILTWYFQSIPYRLSSRRFRNPTMVCFNSLGTLLENLFHLVMVIEETDPIKKEENKQLKNNTKRIPNLLKKIGISVEESHVNHFFELRNDSTHADHAYHHASRKSVTTTPPLSVITTPLEDQLEILCRGIQWAEEIILWRLGYSGQYRDREGSQGVIKPRYDLSLRDSSW